MPSPSALRKRLELIHEFEQLQSRLEAGDETALEPATDILLGVAMCQDCATMASVMKALVGVLESFQEMIDRGGWQYE